MQLESDHIITPHTWCSRMRLNWYILAASAAVWEELADVRLHMLFMEMTTFPSQVRIAADSFINTTKSVSPDCRYPIKSAVVMVCVRHNASGFRRRCDHVQVWFLIGLMWALRLYLTCPGLASSQIDASYGVASSGGLSFTSRMRMLTTVWDAMDWLSEERQMKHHQSHRNWTGSYVQH